MDIRTVVNAENPGRVLANSSVKSFTRTARRAADSSSRTPPPELEYGFTLSSSGGALLILPDGADRHDLRNHHRFLEVATQHGADWYRFAEEKVGQIIANDSLYLITGLYKTTSWSLAAFEKTAGTADYSAQFKIAQADGENIATTSTWDTTRALDWRVGPREKYEFPNQAVFIRGFKIALRTGMFGTKWISVKADAPSTRLNPARSSGAVPADSWLAYMFGGLSTDQTPQPSGSGMQDEAAVDSALDDARDEIQNKGALAVGEHVVIHRIPEASQAFHPSDIINQHLLDKVRRCWIKARSVLNLVIQEPSARIAITHDDVWITMLEKKLLQPEDFAQEGRLETLVSQTYDTISKEGVVYLRNRKFVSFEDSAPIVIGTSSTSTRSGQEQVSALQDPKHSVTFESSQASLVDLPDDPDDEFNPWPVDVPDAPQTNVTDDKTKKQKTTSTTLQNPGFFFKRRPSWVPSNLPGRRDESATPIFLWNADLVDESNYDENANKKDVSPASHGAQEHPRMDWVDPFAAGPRYGPVLDPFLAQVVGANIKLNPLLVLAPSHLQWDMYFHPDRTNLSFPQSQSWEEAWNTPATHPRLTYIRIISRTFPWTIQANAKILGLGITCGEVLDAISTCMYEDMTDEEYGNIPGARIQQIRERHRFNQTVDVDAPWPRPGQCLKRMDWLAFSSKFGGLFANDALVKERCGEVLPCTFELKCGFLFQSGY
ncbi:hypothetical protein JVT61DRAFT_2755 [Boletus reticuloceps]|uniref:DUF6699 domain-containing protein n=1 Tax=Boletus reticuloceps TaxID=495285 RepID=A0A8I3AA39_9AGAM|nr:hypothetical protein JVT61DRAFT_2755 [Boletus reticuloceps]